MFMFSIALTMLVAQAEPAMNADTPELFLEALASASPEQWVESMSPQNCLFDEDSVLWKTGNFQELSVEPGTRVLEDFDGGYRAVFPESRWTWKLQGGRIGSVSGESVVEWRPGGYRWVSVPIFIGEGATVGPKESMCMGVVAMGAVMLVTVMAVWYAKRRYG